ncbi:MULTISPECIES: tryptophan-rich sensory protein [unclassified Phaeobacter]|uniref:tryptophan-rich sensory protein n=2 Tax=unclassified Phaeobacter TaxID=2621772 RepID=UPI003A864C9C
MSKQSMAYLTLALALAFAAAPLITDPFTGYTADQLPYPQPDPVIQPIGPAFSIWIVIYIWLIVGAGFGVFRAPEGSTWHEMRKPLSISLAIGVCWLWVANSSPILATILIIAMTVTAILAMRRAGRNKRVWKRGPVGLYAGWLTAASAVSISIILPGYGLMNPQLAGVICLTAALAVGLLVQADSPSAWTYTVAICWAIGGIIINQWGSDNWLIIALAGLGWIALALRGLSGAGLINTTE